ncbi:MAG: hypothetical protein MK160_11330 [Rhodobacteraceae bacterium]|nr:hypothetical protein [Paracoccaceae bacterium]
MFNKFKSWVRRFCSREEGYVTIEVVMLLPPLLITMAACWVLFDVFRQQAISQKANYTIGDMISRETDPITPAFINGSRGVLRELTRARNDDTRLRVSVVRYDADDNRYSVVWSQKRGSGVRRMNTNMLRANFLDRLPVMADEEHVVLVETWEAYTPAFNIGIDAFDITTYSFTRPRYAPQVLWSTS